LNCVPAWSKQGDKDWQTIWKGSGFFHFFDQKILKVFLKFFVSEKAGTCLSDRCAHFFLKSGHFVEIKKSGLKLSGVKGNRLKCF
jgi:hypothetical protein